MMKRMIAAVALLMGCAGLAMGQATVVDNDGGASNITATSAPPAATTARMAALRIPFIENQGQVADPGVRFYARTFGGTVFVTAEGEIVYALPKYEKGGKDSGFGVQEGAGENARHPTLNAQRSSGDRRKVGGGAEENAQHSTFNIQRSTTEAINSDNRSLSSAPSTIRHQPSTIFCLRERFVGARPAAPAGVGRAATKVSYFKGNDPAKWKTGLGTWESVSLGEAYPGIAVSLKAHGNNVEKLFTVAPGADPGRIRIRVQGVRKMAPWESKMPGNLSFRPNSAT